MKEVILAKYTDTGEHIGDYNTPIEAIKDLGLDYNSVYHILLGKQKTAPYNGRRVTFRRLLKDEDGNYKRL